MSTTPNSAIDYSMSKRKRDLLTAPKPPVVHTSIKYETALRRAFLAGAVDVAEARVQSDFGIAGAESTLKAADRNAGFMRVAGTTRGAFTAGDWMRFGYPANYVTGG